MPGLHDVNELLTEIATLEERSVLAADSNPLLTVSAMVISPWSCQARNAAKASG